MKAKSAVDYIDNEEMIKALCECIAFKSVKEQPQEAMPYGRGVAEALEFVLKKASLMGFKTKNIDGQVGYVEYGSGEEMTAVLGHIDVVPAGSGWHTEPFEAAVCGGKITGRGALDDKGPVIASLYALKAIKDAGAEPKRRIRLIIGTDEESGSGDMKRYRQTEEMPVYAFTPDAYFPVINSEKGMVVFKIEKELAPASDSCLVSAVGGLAVNQVPDSAEIEFRADGRSEHVKNQKGRSAHGSTPELGINAVDDVFEILLQNFGSGDLPDGLREFALFYMKYMHGDTRGVRLGADCRDAVLGDATFNVGELRGDENSIEILVDYRYPADRECEPYLEKIRQVCELNGMKFSVIKKKDGLYFPPKHELIQALGGIYEEETGSEAEPKSMGGGTYAKSLPNTVAFGPLFPGREDTMHRADEYITTEDLIAVSRIYARAMLKLADM